MNVDGVVFGLAALDPILANGGSVSVTASTAGLEANSFDPYYAMTKHAVIGLVRSVAERFNSRNIAVNAFCPGGIDTALVPHQIRAVVPAELLRPPEHIAASLVAMARLRSTGSTWRPGGEPGTVYEYIVPGTA